MASRPARHDVSSGTAAVLPHLRLAAGVDRPAEPVIIELSHVQVRHVVAAACGEDIITAMLSELERLRDVADAGPRRITDRQVDRRYTRSLLFGLVVLYAFPRDGALIGLIELARKLDKNPSTVHRYLITLLAVGLIEHDPASRRYRLAR